MSATFDALAVWSLSDRVATMRTNAPCDGAIAAIIMSATAKSGNFAPTAQGPHLGHARVGARGDAGHDCAVAAPDVERALVDLARAAVVDGPPTEVHVVLVDA